MEQSSEILSNITVFMKYAKYIPELQRRETWTELVDRNKLMHLTKFPHISNEIEEVYKFVYNKKILPSMRSLQFAGKPIDVNPARIFNCSAIAMNHPAAFSEVMFLLLSGVGVGYSVQRHHVEELPEINKPTKTRRYLVADNIEGWSSAVDVLMTAYFKGKSAPIFDFSDIRPKGARLITSGGKAPGPEPLKDCLHNIQKILDRKSTGDTLTPLEIHHINCYIADAVLAGGIRRSACIALFNLDDEEMLTSKYGNWYETSPHLARANNSAVVLRHKIEKDVFNELWGKIEASNSGEPGIFFTNDKEFLTNPCAEVALRSTQFCNLVEINASNIESQQDLDNRAKAAAFIATLQASYTNFHFLRDSWKRITEKEALIGVSLTGIAAGTVLNFDVKQAANVVKTENERVAKLIGINKAARTTVIKPSGTASLVLGTSSGIHAWHSKYYLRRLRVGKNEEIYKYLLENHPELVEDEFFRPTTQAVISIPQKAPEGAITREESALNLLNRIGRVWKDWIKPGHRSGSNLNNVSATVSIRKHEWREVGEWMWENRNNFTALSVLPHDENEHTYIQAPFTPITEAEYNMLVQSLHSVNLANIIETEDETVLQDNLACAGNSCEVQ